MPLFVLFRFARLVLPARREGSLTNASTCQRAGILGLAARVWFLKEKPSGTLKHSWGGPTKRHTIYV